MHGFWVTVCPCLLYTSDAADEEDSVDLGGRRIIKKLKTLPIALEISHKGKKFGFVHGHIEQNDWDEFKDELNNFDKAQHIIDHKRFPTELAMWGRERLNDDNSQYTHVTGVDAVIMGHTVTQKPCKRDNCYWIDTCLLYTSPSPRDLSTSRMPSSA